MLEGLIDLLQEKNELLKERLENYWCANCHIQISESEWRIVNLIALQENSISQIAKSVSISRQGTHKLIKQLEDKKIVNVFNKEQNKRDKFVTLTHFGKECFKKYVNIKKEIEGEIVELVGKENYTMLKKILHKI